MTAGQKLLTSIHNLERRADNREFSEPEIVIQCWLDWGIIFGSYSHYFKRRFPNSKRVSSELVKARKSETISRPRKSTYALTDLGRAIAVGVKASMGGELCRTMSK